MDDINEIISSLSDNDIEMLKGVASSILGEKPDSAPSIVPKKAKRLLYSPAGSSRGRKRRSK